MTFKKPQTWWSKLLPQISAVLCTGTAVIALFASANGMAASLDTIVIDKGYDQQTKIAVVPFNQNGQLGNLPQAADIVSFDLARSGQFAPVERNNMLSLPTAKADVFFRDWRILGVEYLVIGSAAKQPSGEVTLTFHLLDVINEKEMLTQTITAAPSQWRDMVHYASDQVFEAIMGIPGAFSTKILYVLAEGAGTEKPVYRLEVADADGERTRTLLTSDEPIMSAGWSPDAKKIAYVSFEGGRPRIMLHDLASNQREALTSFKGINGSPVYSPDGTQMAMVLSKDGNPEIYVMNLADRRLRRLTKHHAIDTEPSWTPDGKHLIFTSDRGGKPQIYQLELSSNLIERLTFQGDYNARGRMLPDGKHMIFIHRSQGVFHVAWLDIARDDLRVLTSTPLDESPSLAPNGAMLIYATQDRGKGILAVVSIDGRVKYRLPSSSGDVREPAWSPYLNWASGG